MEGEKLRVAGRTAGTAQTQDMRPFQGDWSNYSQLWWTEAKPGARLDLTIPVQRAGKYTVVMQFTRAGDYGIMQAYLDGQKLRWPIDLYHTQVRTHGPFDMGKVDLSEGEHTLTLEIVGTNPSAQKRYMVGLDYVLLSPVE
jgi:hypothetical protein